MKALKKLQGFTYLLTSMFALRRRLCFSRARDFRREIKDHGTKVPNSEEGNKQIVTIYGPSVI